MENQYQNLAKGYQALVVAEDFQPLWINIGFPSKKVNSVIADFFAWGRGGKKHRYNCTATPGSARRSQLDCRGTSARFE
jgi:hypothetical protein